MESAGIVLQQVIIIALLVFTGIIVTKKNIVSEASARGFANLLLMIVVPTFIVKSYIRPFEPDKLLGLAVAFILAIIFHILSIFLTNFIIKKRSDDLYRAERLSAIYANCGFMAFPLLEATMGSEGLFYGTAFVCVFNIFTWTHGVAQLTGEKKIRMKSLLLNPAIIGLTIGLILYFTQIPIPFVVNTTIDYIASLNTPLAMILTGVFLANIKFKDIISDKRIYLATLIKLLVTPLAMILLVKLLFVSSWFADAKIVTTTVMICAACPTAATATLLTAKLGLDSQHGAKIIAVSSFLSILTLPIITYLAELFL